MLKICESGFSSGDQKKAPCRPSVFYRGDVKDDLLLVACDKILFLLLPLGKVNRETSWRVPMGNPVQGDQLRKGLLRRTSARMLQVPSPGGRGAAGLIRKKESENPCNFTGMKGMKRILEQLS
jgi:hypothetical protein